VIRRIRTFWRLPRFVKLWLVPVWAMIGLASAAIALVRFRRLVSGLGRNLGASAYVPLATPAQIARALEINTVIGTAARYAPFRSNCYPQAIVAQILCRLYAIPYALHFGVAYEGAAGTPDRRIKAHVWVVSGPVAVCGGNASFVQFGTVGCFVSPGL
jgi:hypothetical protein